MDKQKFEKWAMNFLSETISLVLCHLIGKNNYDFILFAASDEEKMRPEINDKTAIILTTIKEINKFDRFKSAIEKVLFSDERKENIYYH